MEHNHSNLIIRFMLSFFMVGVGMSLGLFSRSGGDLQSQLVLLVTAIFLLITGIIILRGTFKLRDNCSICKNKYRFGKKKNAL